MKLSEREWTVLNALWETDGAELGTIVNILFPHTGWNRNTVLTYLTRMEAKGLVSITNQHEVGLWSNSYFETTAKPNAEFSDAVRSQSMNCMYVGDDSDKDSINHIAVSMPPVFQCESRPVQLRNPSQELNQEELIEKFWCKSKKFSMKLLPFVHWQCIILIERLYNISIKFSIGGCHGNQT